MGINFSMYVLILIQAELVLHELLYTFSLVQISLVTVMIVITMETIHIDIHCGFHGDDYHDSNDAIM